MNNSVKLGLAIILCLNLCYGQTTRSYVYRFSGYKEKGKNGYLVKDTPFKSAKSIIVTNYSITRLFALAFRLENHKRIIINVRQPEKLKKLYCYKLVVPYNHEDDFYVLMQKSMNEQWPEYSVKMQMKGKDYCLMIRDKAY